MIVYILKRRYVTCVNYYRDSMDFVKCEPLLKEYTDAETAWFIKSRYLWMTVYVLTELVLFQMETWDLLPHLVMSTLNKFIE